MKIVINRCFGGFALSEAAYSKLGLAWDNNGSAYYDNRSDLKLIAVIEELGKLASGSCAQLKVVEIPDGVSWEITDYDGLEEIHELHRSWS